MIRKMLPKDKDEVLKMMRVFYASDAVLSNGSEEIFINDINACVGECPFLEGYVFENDEEIQGYAMLSKGFSTESGKMRIWIEDLYLKEKYRGMGLGSDFFKFLDENYSECVLRLEAEAENERAIKVYEKNGFKVLPYLEMIKND